MLIATLVFLFIAVLALGSLRMAGLDGEEEQ